MMDSNVLNQLDAELLACVSHHGGIVVVEILNLKHALTASFNYITPTLPKLIERSSPPPPFV